MANKRKQVAVAERTANQARWEGALSRWRQSGQPLSVWAREQGLSRDALEYWKRRLQAPQGGTLTLIPITLPSVSGAPIAPPAQAATLPVSSDAVPLELLLGTRRLVLPPGFDSDTLRRAVTVLETC